MDDPIDTAPEHFNIEVYYETDPDPGEFKIGQYLSTMYRENFFNSLHFHNYRSAHNCVEAIAAFQM